MSAWKFGLWDIHHILENTYIFNVRGKHDKYEYNSGASNILLKTYLNKEGFFSDFLCRRNKN